MGEQNQNQNERIEIDGKPVEVIPTVTDFSDTIIGHITLTQEQRDALEKCDAIMRAVFKVTAEIYARLLEVIHPLWDQVVSLVGMGAGCCVNKNIMEAILYAANNNPKWWHLYKNAKKQRTRKKYRRLLEKQLVAKLAAAGKEREADA